MTNHFERRLDEEIIMQKQVDIMAQTYKTINTLKEDIAQK